MRIMFEPRFRTAAIARAEAPAQTHARRTQTRIFLRRLLSPARGCAAAEETVSIEDLARGGECDAKQQKKSFAPFANSSLDGNVVAINR
jgi:hypothetical protein